MPVSRFDIGEFVGDLFIGPAVDRAVLVAAARERGARPAVLDVLRRLRRLRYEHLSDLMADLADLPAAFDPWEAAAADEPAPHEQPSEQKLT